LDSGTEKNCIVLLGTSAVTLGGIAAVIRSYEQAGLFDRWPVVHVPTHRDGSGAQKFALAARSFVRYVAMLMRGRVLLVHVHSASNASFWRKAIFIVAAFAAGRPVIFHLHGGGFEDFYWRRCGPWRRAVVRFILDRSSEIVVLSEVWRRRVSEMTRNANIRPVASPVEAKELLRINRVERSGPVLLFMGRLDRDKGLHELIDALAVLRRQFPALQLRLAGEGDRNGIIAHARARGVMAAVDFAGWVTGPAKIKVWAEASVYVLPSYIEGLPMSVLEAMAAGLPVVASNVGGIPDLIKDDVNGLLVAPRDVPGLVAALERVLRDSALQARLGNAGRELFAASFAPDCVVPQIEAIYRRLGAVPRFLPTEEAGV